MLSEIQEHFVQEYNFSLTLPNKFKALGRPSGLATCSRRPSLPSSRVSGR